MSAVTLTLDAAFATVTALLFAYAGWLTAARRVHSEDGRRATRRFSAWWFGLAAFTILTALNEALAAAGDLDLTTHRILGIVSLAPLIIALWGVVSHLAYIYTGSRRVFAPITVFHALVLVFFLALIAYLTPDRVDVTDWSVSVHYVQELPPSIVALVLLAILAPTILAAVLYGTLYFRTNDRTARYRIGMTSAAFLLWFGLPAATSATTFGQWYYYPVLARVVGIVATLMVILAYQPPRALQERFGVTAVELSGRDDERDGRRRARPVVAPSA